jgi:hypothetical protein
MAQKVRIKAALNKIFRGPKGAFFTVVLLTTLSLLIVLPLIISILKVRADLVSTQRSLNNLIPAVYRISHQMNKEKKMRLELLEMKHRYGGAEEAQKAFNFLTLAASNNNITLKNWERESKEQKGAFIRIPVKMALVCRYADLARYLNVITSSDYICVVTSLNISENRELYPKVSVSIQVELVFIDQSVEIGG